MKWGCVNFSLTCAWWTDLVTLTLEGLRAKHLRLNGGPILAKVLLTGDWQTPNCLTHVQAASLMSSVFLMRFQGDTSKLERGAPAERRRQHENRHSAVWSKEVADGCTVLFVKLSRR